jgi:phage tail protein X
VPAIKFRIPRTAAAFVLSTLLLAAGVYWGRDTIRSVAGPYVMSLLADKDSPKITYVAGPTAGKAPLKEMAAAPAAAPHQIKAAAPPAAQNENQETAAAQLPAAKNESANKESEEQNRPAVSMSESAPPAVPARIKAIVEASNGTSLSKLAIKHYNYVNATIIDYILEANPSIIHPDIILIKQKIRLPEITLNSCIKPSGNGEFRIHLATFVSRTFAEQYIEKTGLSRRDTSIFPRKVSGRDMWFRVMSGPYQSWDKTMDALGNFKNRGLLAF